MLSRKKLFAALALVAGLAVSSSAARAEEDGGYGMKKAWIVKNLCEYCGPLDWGVDCTCVQAEQ